MPSQAHTPGPWSFTETHGLISGQSKQVRTVIGGQPGEIVTVADRIRNPADARLIAAAPEMLAALQEIVALPGFEPNEPYGTKARALLARLSGDSQTKVEGTNA